MSPIIGSFSSGSAFGRKGGLPPSNLIYPFTTATFTPGGASGRNGPDLTQARNGITSPTKADWANNTTYFNTSSGYQFWTVPGDGVYRIECAGARGGNNGSFSGGNGYVLRCDFTFTENLQLKILVGQQGPDSTAGCDTGSGGGTFVATTANVPIIVAGGGSGSTSSRAGKPGVSTESGSGSDNGGGGGSNGNGGSASAAGAAGGAGFFGNGNNSGSWTTAATSFTNGGTGGPTASAAYANGGFGGGSGGHGNCWIGSGGAGGYSGGGGGNNGSNPPGSGGGGGSFTTSSFSATNRVNVGANNSSDGYVTITYLG